MLHARTHENCHRVFSAPLRCMCMCARTIQMIFPDLWTRPTSIVEDPRPMYYVIQVYNLYQDI